MPLNIPSSSKEIKQRSQADVQNNLPDSNPFLPNSYLDAIISATSGRNYDFYVNLEKVITQLFPDTATGDFLERWGSYMGVLRKPATQSSGKITATGTASSVIPLGTQLASLSGKVYETTQTATIENQNISIQSLTRVGQTVTATTTSDHLLTSNQSVDISGAVEPEYNGTYNIIVTSSTAFTYTITGTPSTPATGTIVANVDFASLSIKSTGFGEDNNLDPNTQLKFSTPIAGVNNTARVQQSSISGGADQESDDNLRQRIIFRYQNPVALFNKSAIIVKAKEVPGVTRVFVKSPGTVLNTLSATSVTRSDSIVTVKTSANHNLEDGQLMTVSGADQDDYNVTKKVIVIDDDEFAYAIGSTPTTPATGTISVGVSIPNGQVFVYFTLDNNDNIIPNATDIANVKDALVNSNDGIKPANVDSNDVVVKGPDPVTVNFTFSGLSPNTTSMQNAIEANLEAFFTEDTSVGKDVLKTAYESAIFRTIDTETGSVVESFTLSAPTTDITINEGQIAILGTITFT